MSKPTTTRGYISLLMKVASVSIESLKGIEDLSEEIQKELIFIRGEIYNTIGEIDKEQVKVNKLMEEQK